VAERTRPRSAVRTAVVWDVLRGALAERLAATVQSRLDVVDAGGGTGGFAVPLAELGHTVTVVDPSPDSLAALERRAAEAGVSERVRGVQGDVAGLSEVLGAAGCDIVLCHSVLEVVDDPAVAARAVAAALRPGGLVSVLTANRAAAVLHRALLGRFDEARSAFSDPRGRWGPADPTPRRFTLPELVDLLGGAGLQVGSVHGVRVFADLVPGGLLDAEPGALDALVALEAAVAETPTYRDVATQLHVLAVRRNGG
jgi:SAM-dependent methyltransferase